MKTLADWVYPNIQTLSVDKLRDELIYLTRKPAAIASPLSRAIRQELVRRGLQA